MNSGETKVNTRFRVLKEKTDALYSVVLYLIQSNIRLRPPTVSDRLCSATSFPKYETFPRQITIFETSCMQLPLLNDSDPFLELKV